MATKGNVRSYDHYAVVDNKVHYQVTQPGVFTFRQPLTGLHKVTTARNAALKKLQETEKKLIGLHKKIVAKNSKHSKKPNSDNRKILQQCLTFFKSNQTDKSVEALRTCFSTINQTWSNTFESLLSAYTDALATLKKNELDYHATHTSTGAMATSVRGLDLKSRGPLTNEDAAAAWQCNVLPASGNAATDENEQMVFAEVMLEGELLVKEFSSRIEQAIKHKGTEFYQNGASAVYSFVWKDPKTNKVKTLTGNLGNCSSHLVEITLPEMVTTTVTTTDQKQDQKKSESLAKVTVKSLTSKHRLSTNFNNPYEGLDEKEKNRLEEIGAAYVWDGKMWGISPTETLLADDDFGNLDSESEIKADSFENLHKKLDASNQYVIFKDRDKKQQKATCVTHKRTSKCLMTTRSHGDLVFKGLGWVSGEPEVSPLVEFNVETTVNLHKLNFVLQTTSGITLSAAEIQTLIENCVARCVKNSKKPKNEDFLVLLRREIHLDLINDSHKGTSRKSISAKNYSLQSLAVKNSSDKNPANQTVADGSAAMGNQTVQSMPLDASTLQPGQVRLMVTANGHGKENGHKLAHLICEQAPTIFADMMQERMCAYREGAEFTAQNARKKSHYYTLTDFSDLDDAKKEGWVYCANANVKGDGAEIQHRQNTANLEQKQGAAFADYHEEIYKLVSDDADIRALRESYNNHAPKKANNEHSSNVVHFSRQAEEASVGRITDNLFKLCNDSEVQKSPAYLSLSDKGKNAFAKLLQKRPLEEKHDVNYAQACDETQTGIVSVRGTTDLCLETAKAFALSIDHFETVTEKETHLGLSAAVTEQVGTHLSNTARVTNRNYIKAGEIVGGALLNDQDWEDKDTKVGILREVFAVLQSKEKVKAKHAAASEKKVESKVQVPTDQGVQLGLAVVQAGQIHVRSERAGQFYAVILKADGSVSCRVVASKMSLRNGAVTDKVFLIGASKGFRLSESDHADDKTRVEIEPKKIEQTVKNYFDEHEENTDPAITNRDLALYLTSQAVLKGSTDNVNVAVTSINSKDRLNVKYLMVAEGQTNKDESAAYGCYQKIDRVLNNTVYPRVTKKCEAEITRLESSNDPKYQAAGDHLRKQWNKATNKLAHQAPEIVRHYQGFIMKQAELAKVCYPAKDQTQSQPVAENDLVAKYKAKQEMEANLRLVKTRVKQLDKIARTELEPREKFKAAIPDILLSLTGIGFIFVEAPCLLLTGKGFFYRHTERRDLSSPQRKKFHTEEKKLEVEIATLDKEIAGLEVKSNSPTNAVG